MSLNIYHVTQGDLYHDDYEVWVNDQKVALDTARVSLVPFNRRWPGHQRQIDQSELINFLSMATDEPLNFRIRPKKPFDKVTIRPLSLGIEPIVSEDGEISFTLDKPAYFTVEPYCRENALHLFVDPIAEYKVDVNSPDVIYYGAGAHEVGDIVLTSNQTLFIDEGAVVYGCIKAIDAENIKIIGRGILDNSHNKEIILFEANVANNFAAVNNATRQHTIQLEYCTNVEIEGITIRDSLVYNIRPIGCENLNISNVKIIGCWRFNSDGIDMHNCLNVVIDNCFLRTFDDSICVKGFDCYYEGDVEEAVHNAMYRNGKSYDIFANVRVRNCTIWNDWGKCLEIGAETRGEEIYDVVFEDCKIIHVTHSVLDCYNVDYADVHDITYRNIDVEYDDVIPCPACQRDDDHSYSSSSLDFSPSLISALVQYHAEYSAGGTRRGRNRRLLFENIRYYGRHKLTFKFNGYNEEYRCEDITIKNIFVNGRPLREEDFTLTIGDFCKNIKVEL